MGQSRKITTAKFSEFGSADRFPETQRSILQAAADGDWQRFLQQYLRPCWREIVITCRQRGLSLPDTEDLFQDLLLRIIRRGKLKPVSATDRAAKPPGKTEEHNLPGRYIQAIEAKLQQARFRTFLKATIVNVVREEVRRRNRRAHRQLVDQMEAVMPSVREIVDDSLEIDWLQACVYEAAARLRQQSIAARTRGQRRLFDVLFYSVVDGLAADEIAARLDLGRSTISGLLSQARKQFVSALQEETGVADAIELKQIVRRDPQTVNRALRLAKKRFPTRGFHSRKN